MAVLALVCAPAAARAQAPEPDAPRTFALRLDYILGEGAASCPGEEMLRQELGRRLGYDPAAPDAKRIPAGRLITVIARSARGLTATYEYIDAAGVHAWTKSYPVSGTSRSACEVAISGVAVEMATELVHLRRRMPPEPPPSPPATPPPLPPPEPSPPPPPAPEPVRDAPPPSALRIRGEVGAGAFAAGGLAPRLAFGGVLHGGIALIPRGEARAAFSIAVEARADLPASDAFGARRTIHAQFLGGSLLTCIHKDVAVTAPVAWSLFGCAIGTAGVLRGGVERADGRGSDGGVYVAAGARPGVEARLSTLVALRLQGDLEATIKPRRIVSLTSGEGWQTGSMSGNVGVAAVFFFGGADGSGSSP